MTPILPVVMTGGVGARLWPLSRVQRPKPFHALVGDRTMLAATLERLAGEADGVVFERPLVIAGEAHAEAAVQALAGRSAQLVLEPVGRSTAACAVVAAEFAARTDPGRLILIAPSDHLIVEPAAFRAAVSVGAEAAVEGRLVIFGVPPDRPETGYGYILAQGDGAVRPVTAFVEKPDAVTATAYLADGRYLWNAGVFLMRADRLLLEMQRLRPDIREAAALALTLAVESDGALRLDRAAFEACPSESLDRAVMEHTRDAVVVPLDVGWSDVGDYDALWAASRQDAAGNVVVGDAILLDSRGSFVSTDGPTVAVLGGLDLVVVVREGAVLVAPRARAQEVRAVVDALTAAGRTDRL